MQQNNLRLLHRTGTYGCCEFEIFALNMTAFPAIPLPPSSLTHHMFSSPLTPTHHHPHTTTYTPPPTHHYPHTTHTPPPTHHHPHTRTLQVIDDQRMLTQLSHKVEPPEERPLSTWRHIIFSSPIQHSRCMFLPQIYHRCYMYGVYKMSLYNGMMFL